MRLHDAAARLGGADFVSFIALVCDMQDTRWCCLLKATQNVSAKNVQTEDRFALQRLAAKEPVPCVMRSDAGHNRGAKRARADAVPSRFAALC